MSLTQMLPDIQSLSKAEKLHLIQLLAQDLATGEESPIVANGSYPVWSPDTAFAAADVMLKALEDDRQRP